MIKIAIVGLGPSGIYCAIHILEKLKQKNFNKFFIDIYEKDFPLKTMLPTGNGRCNITNAAYDIDEFVENYPRGKQFLKSIYSRYFNFDTIEFLDRISIPTVIEENNRVFPVSQSSKDVREKFLTYLKTFNNYKIIKKEISNFSDLKNYNFIVIAAGSKNSENLIKSSKHTLVPFRKSLVELKIKEQTNLQGVSIKAKDGDFVFTKDGISGPLAFKISSINAYQKMPYKIEIKLFDEEELFNLIKLNPKKSIGTIISNLIPKALAHYIIDDYTSKAAEISKEKLKEYSKLNLNILSTSKKGEIVRAGGVDLNEINNHCCSKINNNTYFVGEILNIDGFTGGYNLQNCWSTGYIAANNIVKRILTNK